MARGIAERPRANEQRTAQDQIPDVAEFRISPLIHDVLRRETLAVAALRRTWMNAGAFIDAECSEPPPK